MSGNNLLRWASLVLFVPLLACAVLKQTPQPGPTIEQRAFDIQTSTPTPTPVRVLFNAPTHTPDPNATATPVITSTLIATPTLQSSEATTEASAAAQAEPTLAPTVPPAPTPTVPLAEPLRGGEWDFEVGFQDWGNPHGDPCGGAGLATGWSAFTTRDQYGSSCMNQTTWKDNVYTGESAQEITFAYIGNEAGVFKTAPTIPGHQYTIEAFMRREFSPTPVEVALGIDLTGGTNWQAETVQWFPWNENLDDQWARTEITITAAGETMTVFLEGSHAYPEPGGTLRLDSISIVDAGPG